MEVYADGWNEKDIEARDRLARVIVTSVAKVRLAACIFLLKVFLPKVFFAGQGKGGGMLERRDER